MSRTKKENKMKPSTSRTDPSEEQEDKLVLKPEPNVARDPERDVEEPPDDMLPLARSASDCTRLVKFYSLYTNRREGCTVTFTQERRHVHWPSAHHAPMSPYSKDYQKQHPSAQHTTCLLHWVSPGPALGITCDQQSPHTATRTPCVSQNKDLSG